MKIHKTTILPLVLYGCEHILNRVLRRIFGQKRGEIG
jgi:hypothetical protein